MEKFVTEQAAREHYTGIIVELIQNCDSINMLCYIATFIRMMEERRKAEKA